MSYEFIDVERTGAVVNVWMNRPECLNALNDNILDEIGDVFHALQSDLEVRVVVLGGRGRAFSSGADRREGPSRFRDAKSGRAKRYASQIGRRAMQAITDLEAITIARVQGHAIGGGFCLALACDFRIASRETQFHIPEVDLGVPLNWGATPRLIYEVGPLKAKEWIVMCNKISTQEALEAGAINCVVSEEDLDEEIERWVKRIGEKSELALHMVKTQFRGYSRVAFLGDSSETDGDMGGIASHSEEFRKAFGSES